MISHSISRKAAGTRLLALFCALMLGACHSSTTAPPASQHATSAAPSTAAASDSVSQKWARSCALCHVDGNGGAPRVGNADEWLPRLAKGEDQLLQHTIEGYNNMPPLGYCMACEREDFAALIALMTVGMTAGQEQPR